LESLLHGTKEVRHLIGLSLRSKFIMTFFLTSTIQRTSEPLNLILILCAMFFIKSVLVMYVRLTSYRIPSEHVAFFHYAAVGTPSHVTQPLGNLLRSSS